MSLPRKLTIYANVFRLILIYIYIFMTLQFTNGIKVLVKYMKTLLWLDNLCNIIYLYVCLHNDVNDLRYIIVFLIKSSTKMLNICLIIRNF